MKIVTISMNPTNQDLDEDGFSEAQIVSIRMQTSTRAGVKFLIMGETTTVIQRHLMMILMKTHLFGPLIAMMKTRWLIRPAGNCFTTELMMTVIPIPWMTMLIMMASGHSKQGGMIVVMCRQQLIQEHPKCRIMALTMIVMPPRQTMI